MREKIQAVVEELKRRKAAGETYVLVEPESVDSLKKAATGSSRKTVPAGAPLVLSPERPVEKAVAPKAPAPAVPVARLESEESYVAPKPRVTERVEESAATASGPAPIPPPPVFSIPDGDKRAKWEWLRQRVISCPVCNAHLNPGKKVVFGVGDINSPIFFCGEAPGADEEELGEPFVGRAGQLLEKIILAMGLSREKVYIGNIMNWRPQTGSSVGNRPPTDEEMAYCLPYLKAQLAVVQPKVIVALGNTAFKGLLGARAPGITSARGRWFEFDGVALMPTFHPSYVLRYGTNETKRQIWDDMLLVMEKVGMPVSEKQRGFFMPKGAAE